MFRRLLARVAIVGLTLGLAGCSPAPLRLHALKLAASGEVVMVVHLCPGMGVLSVSAFENGQPAASHSRKWRASPAVDFPTQFEVPLLGTPQQWTVKDSSDLALFEENMEYGSGIATNATTGSVRFTLADLRQLPAGKV